MEKYKCVARDIQHNRHYMDQLITHLEKEITTTSTYMSFLKLFVIIVKAYFLLGDYTIQQLSSNPASSVNNVA